MNLRMALLAGGIVLLAAAADLGAADDKEKPAISAVEFTKEYGTDPEGFDKKYKGKVVLIEGLVELGNFKDSLSNNIFLMIKGYKKAGEPVDYSVRCVSGPDFAAVRIGHTIRVQGTCQGHSKTSFAAELRDCKLVKVLADDYPPTKAVQEEIAKLKGKWKVTAAEADGKQLAPKDVGFDEITIEGYQFDLKAGDRIMTWGLSIDPAKTPRLLDLVNPDQSKLPLIYVLEGDKLRLGFPAAVKDPKDGKRPESFDTTKSKMLVLSAERQK